ncbi:MAG: hypothetical protein AMS24_01495 [Chlamydiae bacterium SM23_39]|nr:MAG: hypothetical protein AMS24_01495 [Chlamydiae bacterium SM23_39]
MILKKLFLHNFRNFDNEKFIFEKRNIIYGKNAQGKTSILEAIFLLSLGRSFRTSKLTELIKHKKKFFFIEAEIIKDLVTQKISIYFDRNNKKKIKHNHTSIYSFSHLFGIMPTILHSPYDINIISGYPTKRRRFLNIHLAQKDPLYVYHLTRFYRALKQRNTLLQKKLLTNIEIWEDEIAKSASYITYARNKLLLLLKNPIQNSIDSLSEKTEKIDLKYLPGLSFQEDTKKTYLSYLQQLEKNRKKDLYMGTTQFGPHRDDFTIYISKKPAKNYASEGQKYSISTAIRLAEYKILNYNAIINIDDIGVHLDEKRIYNLKQILESFSQIFITTSIKNEIFEKENIIKIQEGKIVY